MTKTDQERLEQLSQVTQDLVAHAQKLSGGDPTLATTALGHAAMAMLVLGEIDPDEGFFDNLRATWTDMRTFVAAYVKTDDSGSVH